MDTVDKIIKYEQGLMEIDETVEFFGELVKTGICWQLQGHYGRTAVRLIDGDFIDRHGNILNETLHNPACPNDSNRQAGPPF